MDNFSYVLKDKYNIETQIRNNYPQRGYLSLYVKNSSRAVLTKLVKQHILPSQHHPFNKPSLKLTLFGCSQLKRGFITLPDLTYLRDSKRKFRKEYILSLEQKEAQWV